MSESSAGFLIPIFFPFNRLTVAITTLILVRIGTIDFQWHAMEINEIWSP